MIIFLLQEPPRLDETFIANYLAWSHLAIGTTGQTGHERKRSSLGQSRSKIEKSKILTETDRDLAFSFRDRSVRSYQ